jgi:RNA-binding protein
MSEQENLKFSSAEINLVLHATEDEDTVLKAIEDILLVPSDRFSSSASEGHFKNKIVLQKAILSSHEAGLLAKRVMSLLNRPDRVRLARLVHEYSDEKGNLYIRLDKQRMCQGRVSLSETDAIRIRFKPVKRYKRSGAIQGYEGLFDLRLNV